MADRPTVAALLFALAALTPCVVGAQTSDDFGVLREEDAMHGEVPNAGVPTPRAPRASSGPGLAPPEQAPSPPGRGAAAPQPALADELTLNDADKESLWRPGAWQADSDCDSCVDQNGYDLGGGLRKRLRERFGPPGSHGVPLKQESWRNRPLSAGAFFGGLWPEDLLDGRVTSGTGFLAGPRFGWDFSDHFGVESRFAFTKFALQYPHDPLMVHDANLFMWDGSMLWYPWGNNKYRPFFTLGFGLADIQWYNELDQRDHDTLFSMPFGLGIKYRWDSRIVFRTEFLDNLAFGSGSGLNNLHNLSLTAGFEFRMGGATRRSYWPWNPSRQWW